MNITDGKTPTEFFTIPCGDANPVGQDADFSGKYREVDGIILRRTQLCDTALPADLQGKRCAFPNGDGVR